MSRLRRFLDEAWSELKKVSWPTREQVRNLTVLVFVVSFWLLRQAFKRRSGGLGFR